MNGASLPPVVFAGFAEKLRQRLGFSFTGVREASLVAGIHQVSKQRGESPEVLLQRLDDEPSVWEAIVAAVTIGETYFFRRPEHFELVREVFYRTPGAIRLWSAGCATGEEPYSLAILALECLGKDAYERVTILGTDVNPEFLSRAARGIYRTWSFRGLSPARLQQHFSATEDGYQLSPSVSRLVQFRRLNLMSPSDPWPREQDLILCRNVTVYFAPAEAHEAVERLSESLRWGGWLIQDATDPCVAVPQLVASRQRNMLAFQRLAADAKATSSVPSVPSPPPAPRYVAAPKARVPRPQPPTVPVPVATANAASSLTREPPPPTVPVPVAAPADALSEARRCADRGDTEDAVRWLDRAMDQAPFCVEAHVLRAFVEQRRGRHRYALQAAQQALLLEPSHLQAHFARISSLVTLRRTSEARNALQRARRHLDALGPRQGWGPLSRPELENLWSALNTLCTQDLSS